MISKYLSHIKLIIIPIMLIFLMGAAKGVRDAVQFHPDEVHKVLPFLDNDFWNTPALTWCNKYKSCESKEERFFGSAGMFVFATDAWHLMEFLIIAFSLLAIVLYKPFSFGWFLVFDFAMFWIVRQAGFHLFYNIIF